MKELKNYYEKSKKKWFYITVSVWVILTMIFSVMEKAFSKLVTIWAINQDLISESYIQVLFVFLSALVPTTIVFVSYFSILNYIDQKGWKKKFPQYDISGKWLGTVDFTESINDGGIWSTSKETSKSTAVNIVQTCNTIKIEPSFGDDMVFYSILADWDEMGSLNIFYKAEYYKPLQKQGFPAFRYGYERLYIDTTDLPPKEKPLKIKGDFRHCLSDDGKPIFMGDVTYERVKK